jgi:hypothetical protein
MAAVATLLLDAREFYVLGAENGPVYLAILEIRRLPALH